MVKHKKIKTTKAVSKDTRLKKEIAEKLTDVQPPLRYKQKVWK